MKAKFPILLNNESESQDEPKRSPCKHAASGCDYPVGECIGLCGAKPINPVLSRSHHRLG